MDGEEITWNPIIYIGEDDIYRGNNFKGALRF